MTKKNYLKFAQLVNSERKLGEAPTKAVHRLAEGISAICQEDNKLFDHDRFMRACGFQTKETTNNQS